MKIALIFSGKLRTFMNNIYNNIKKFEDADIEIGIYIHVSESKYDIDDKYLPSNIKYDELMSLPYIQKIIYSNEKYIKNNVYKQWKKLNEIWKVVENSYDLYMRIRPDVALIDITKFINEIDFKCINIPNGQNYYKQINEPFYINDQICIGEYDLMNTYCNLINEFSEIESDSISQKILHTYLFKKTNLFNKINRVNLKYKLVLSEVNVIGICGDSGSGKSTLVKILESVLPYDNSLTLETDRYHKWERGHENWKEKTHLNPETNFLEKMEGDAFDLKIGSEIYQIDYDHTNGKFTPKQKIESKGNITIVGLHTLTPKNIQNLYNTTIYLDTNVWLKTFWKIKRDQKNRGYTIDQVLENIEKRKNDYEKFILPQKDFADVIIKYYCPLLQNIEDIKKYLNTNIKIEMELFISKLYLNKITKNSVLFKTFTLIQKNDKYLLKLNDDIDLIAELNKLSIPIDKLYINNIIKYFYLIVQT